MKFEIAKEADITMMSKAVLTKLTLGGKKLLVTIAEFKRNRSSEQNALYWKWLTEIGNELGCSKDEMHEVYKEQFLIGIYTRDDQEFAEMAHAIKAISTGNKAEYKAIRKQVISMTSTTKANVKQMREYLTNIKHHAQGELGIRLTDPEFDDLL